MVKFPLKLLLKTVLFSSLQSGCWHEMYWDSKCQWSSWQWSILARHQSFKHSTFETDGRLDHHYKYQIDDVELKMERNVVIFREC